MKHGTLAMATTGGCHCQSCRDEQTRYVKRWRLARSRGVRFMVPAAPSHRKVQALNAIGHTRAAIAAEMGVTPAAVTNLMAHDRIRSATEVKVEQAYRAMEMRIAPDTVAARRARAVAAERGWPPPLAYDDIHAGILAQLDGAEEVKFFDRFDEDLIDYVMQYHDFEVRLNPAEKSEIVRRWTRSVGSEAQLCSLTGWREGRYRSPHPDHQQSPEEAA